MYADLSQSSTSSMEEPATPTGHVHSLSYEAGAVAIRQGTRELQGCAQQQAAIAQLSTSAPVSIPADRGANRVVPLHRSPDVATRHPPQAPVTQDHSVGRSWSPSVGRRISTGSLGASVSPSRPASDDEELAKRRAQQRRRVGPQSRFNRQRFDIDRAPSLDSKSARKRSGMRYPAQLDDAAGNGGGASSSAIAQLSNLHASPNHRGRDLSKMTSKQRKKLLQREIRAARAAKAGFDPAAIAEELLQFAESSYDGSSPGSTSAGNAQVAGTSDGGSSPTRGRPDPFDAAVGPITDEQALRIQTASPPLAGPYMESSKSRIISCGGSAAGCAWTETAAEVCGLQARIVGKRGKQTVEVWRWERAGGGGRGGGGERRWTGGRKGVLDHEARSELDAMVAEAMAEIQQGSTTDGIVTPYGVAKTDSRTGRGWGCASKRAKGDNRNAKASGKNLGKSGFADMPVMFVSGGIIADGSDHHHVQAPCTVPAGLDRSVAQPQGVDQDNVPDGQQCLSQAMQAEDASMNGALGEAECAMGDCDMPIQRPVSQEPPVIVGFTTAASSEHAAMCSTAPDHKPPSTLLASAFQDLEVEDGPPRLDVGDTAAGRLVPATMDSKPNNAVAQLDDGTTGALTGAMSSALGQMLPNEQPQQLSPLPNRQESSSDDAAFTCPGLGFRTQASMDQPTEGLGYTSTADMVDAGPSSIAAHAAQEQSRLDTEARLAESTVQTQAEVPVFELDMPILGQGRSDRGAPELAAAVQLSQVRVNINLSPLQCCSAPQHNFTL